jgi:recombination protein RecA
MGQGKNNAVAFLKENTKIRYELENRIREKHEIPLIELDDIEEGKGEDEKKE